MVPVSIPERKAKTDWRLTYNNLFYYMELKFMAYASTLPIEIKLNAQVVEINGVDIFIVHVSEYEKSMAR